MGGPLAASPAGFPPLVRLLTGAVLAAAIAAQWSPAFATYDSDLWTYVLIVERVADGQDVLGQEPFRLEPPASPHVTVIWLGLGYLRRWSGLPSLDLVRAFALASIALLCAGAWVLAGRLFGRGWLRGVALLLFWFAMPETWSAVALGRYLSLAWVALAAAAALAIDEHPRATALTAAFVALGFYTHLFGGVLAAAAVLIVAVARGRGGEAPRPRALVSALVGGAVLAAPCLGYALATAGLSRTSAHTWRPEQVEALGFRLMSPGQLLELFPASVLGLALVGLVVPPRPERRRARAIAGVGTLLCALVLLTPLYHWAVEWFGGWMVGRVAALAFPWVSAALALEWMLGDGRAWARRAAVAALLAVVAAQGFGRAASDWRDRAYAFTAAARGEALALRETLRGHTYLAPSLIGYGVAAPTLGRPLAVPPGHASPFGDFRRQERRVHRALAANTEECWAALLGLYPDVAFLLTPAAGATVERRIWQERLPETSPEAVRERLRALGALEPVHEGPTFVLDALRPAPFLAGRSPRRGGMGSGRSCREEP